jgi:hypothetical protein
MIVIFHLKNPRWEIFCVSYFETIYGMLDNLEEVSLGFQPDNPVTFDTKSSTLNALKDNQFFGKSYKTTKPPSVSKTIQEAQVVWIFTHWPHKILAQTFKWHNRYL